MRPRGRARAAALRALYTVADEAEVDQLLGAHPSLLPLLVLAHEEIRTHFGDGHGALLDAVRAIPSGRPVGLIVLICPASDDVAALAHYERLLAWFRAGPSRAARGRLALGLVPAARSTHAANDNADDAPLTGSSAVD